MGSLGFHPLELQTKCLGERAGSLGPQPLEMAASLVLVVVLFLFPATRPSPRRIFSPPSLRPSPFSAPGQRGGQATVLGTRRARAEGRAEGRLGLLLILREF